MPKTNIPCRRCRGTGLQPISRRLEQVLVALPQGGATSDELHGLLLERHGGTFGVTAINGRLEQLRALGLVGRRQEGRGIRYFRSSKKTKAKNTP